MKEKIVVFFIYLRMLFCIWFLKKMTVNHFEESDKNNVLSLYSEILQVPENQESKILNKMQIKMRKSVESLINERIILKRE